MLCLVLQQSLSICRVKVHWVLSYRSMTKCVGLQCVACHCVLTHNSVSQRIRLHCVACHSVLPYRNVSQCIRLQCVSCHLVLSCSIIQLCVHPCSPRPRIPWSTFNLMLYILGGLHNISSVMLFVTYMMLKHPRMPNFKSFLDCFKNCFK